MKLFAVWNGGASYGPSYTPEHTEVFESLQAVKDELSARRYSGRADIKHLDGTTENTGTPCVEEDSEFLVWSYGDGTEFPDYGRRVFFGPRGGIRVENF